MGSELSVSFADAWMWLIFIGIGLVFVIAELLLGVETGLDLVFIGSAFVLGGLITLAFHSWIWTAVVSGVIAVVYLVVGRRYIHRRMYKDVVPTNIDAIVGQAGIVRETVAPGRDGLVRVANEDWKARSEETLETGQAITVTGVHGVTLTVIKKENGGNA